MNIYQILFLILWLLLFIVTLAMVMRSKKATVFQRVMLVIISATIPVLGSLIALVLLSGLGDAFWSNSATRDSMWIANSDIGDGSSGEGGSAD